MTDMELLAQAKEKGFLNAATICPAHLKGTGSRPIVMVPEDAILVEDCGNLYFRWKGKNNLPDSINPKNLWTGLVYDRSYGGSWATIVTTRQSEEPKRELYPPFLTIFPIRGVCWKPTVELLKYLQSRDGGRVSGQAHSAKTIENRGLAWNETGLWVVNSASSQPKFTIEQLQPFLTPSQKEHPVVGEWYYYMGAEAGGLDTEGFWEKGVLAKFKSIRSYDTISWEFSETSSPNMTHSGASNKACAFRKATEQELIDAGIKQKPLTPEECFKPEELYPGDKITYYDPEHICHGIHGIVEKVYTDEHKRLVVELRKPLPKHPQGGELLSYPVSKARLIKRNTPEKWCIRITEENRLVLKEFLFSKKEEYKGYSDGWDPIHGYYLFYPQAKKGIYSAKYPDHFKDYTIVTLDQIKHVLTESKIKENFNSLKPEQNARQQGNNSDSESGTICKIQRPNLAIRRDSDVREIGIRCPKSKIRLGAIDSEDQIGLSRSEADIIQSKKSQSL